MSRFKSNVNLSMDDASIDTLFEDTPPPSPVPASNDTESACYTPSPYQLVGTVKRRPSQSASTNGDSNQPYVDQLMAYKSILNDRIKANHLSTLYKTCIGPPQPHPEQKCLNCLHPFNTSPIGIPIEKLSNVEKVPSYFPYFMNQKKRTKTHYINKGYVYKTFGTACTWACALYYIKYDPNFPRNRTKCEIFLKEMFQFSVRNVYTQSNDDDQAKPDEQSFLFKSINPLCINTPLCHAAMKHPMHKYQLMEAPPRVLLSIPREDGGMSIEEYRRQDRCTVYNMLLPPCISSYACLETTVADIAHLDKLIEWNSRIMLPDKKSAMIQAPKLHDDTVVMTTNSLKTLKEVHEAQQKRLELDGHSKTQISDHFKRQTSAISIPDGKDTDMRSTVSQKNKRNPAPKRGRAPKQKKGANAVCVSKPKRAKPTNKSADFVTAFGIYVDA